MKTGHLLHIGFPKTGSNFLRSWFAIHPQIAFVHGGIAGFRDVYAIPIEAAAPNHQIRFRVTSSEVIVAPNRFAGSLIEDVDREDLVFPNAQKAACSILASLFPGALVLVVTRGFRSMLVSTYSQYVRMGGSLPFSVFCADFERETRQGNQLWDYDRVIDIYMRSYGAEQVMVMPYELLQDDVGAFISYIENTLGLEHHSAPSRRTNPSISQEEMMWYPRLTRKVRALPVGSWLHRRILSRYLQRTMVNGFRLPIRILNRISPVRPIVPADVPSSLITELARGAERLLEMPLYAPYQSHYLE